MKLLLPFLVTLTMININHGTLQGDAHLLEFGDGTRLLVDAGNNDNALVDYFKAKQITELSRVVVSHAHKDHYAGIPELLAAGVKITGAVWMNFPARAQCDAEKPWGCDWEDLARFREKVKGFGVPILNDERGTVHFTSPKMPDTELRTLYAFTNANSPIGPLDPNNMSSILLLRTGGAKALFTGDLNAGIGEFLAKNGEELQADIIKVPHHGGESVAPNSFLDRVNASFALVPGPKGLWDDARSKRIRDYYASKKIPIFVNGVNGNVRVSIFEDRFEIKPDQGAAIVSFPQKLVPRKIAGYTRP